MTSGPAKQQQPIVERVILPLYGHGDESSLVMAATVLASWLDTPLQLVAPDQQSADECETLVGALGVVTEPVVCITSMSFLEGVAEHARAVGPSVCVTTVGRGGLELAHSSGQATFLAPSTRRSRLPSGPMVVEVTGYPTDLAPLATAALWARKLECGVRLLVDSSRVPQEQVVRAEQRLAEIGVDVGIDSLRAEHVPPLVLLGRTRDSTAVVVSSDRLPSEDLMARADAQGVPLLIAASARRTGADDDPSRGAVGGHEPGQPSSDDEGLEVMSYEQCLAAVDGQSIGRIGYVDHGWPTIVPVNYSLQNGEIFIRSHRGGKLDAARRHDVVCLEVDSVDESTRSGWSVVGHGHLEIINEPSTLRIAWANDPSPWVKSDEWHWLRFIPFSLTGRRLPPH